MRPASLLSLGLIAAGAAASAGTLARRRRWEHANRRAYVVLDYDDAQAVSTRAGLPLVEFLDAARRHGATHLSLPELTLQRLMLAGRLAPAIPAQPIAQPPRVGRWVHLATAEAELAEHLARELAARVPQSQARVLTEGPIHLLALAGDLPTLAEMGLGFETGAAAEILLAGLDLVPRPVSFAWPEDYLIERTLNQVAGLGARVAAFDGDMILGHEMHLDTTVACLERLGLTFAYFAETRHQKGDWFVAKRLARRGQVVLAHYFTPAAMVPEDFHSAAHQWGMLARARGIRLCYVNVFRRLHATEPLECLHYLEHIREELESLGLAFADTPAPVLSPPDRQSLALTGLAAAGTASLAAASALDLPEPAALAVTSLAAAVAAAVPYLDRPRGSLEQTYAPSYAPKLLALAGAVSAPVAASQSEVALEAALIQSGAAAALAALTTGQEYQQRIENYRSLNADVFLPLAGLWLREAGDRRLQVLGLAALGAAWMASNRLAPDVLGALDRDLPAGHTHHLSRAQRALGDLALALGPRPARKWTWLGPAGLAAAQALRRQGRSDLAALAAAAGLAGFAVMLATFRRPERPLDDGLPSIAKSWLWGTAAAVGLRLLAGSGGRP